MSEAPSGPGTSDAAHLADALDALVAALGVVHTRLRAASPAVRALIDDQAFWEENFLWTDGTMVERAAERLADLLRGYPSGPEAR